MGRLRARRERWLKKARLIGSSATTITAARKAWKKTSIQTRLDVIRHLDSKCISNECSFCKETAA